MVLVVLILALSSITSLESWQVLHGNRYDLVENWGITRVKRQIRIRKKFPDHPLMVCDMLHKTAEAPFTAIVLYKTSGRLLCMGSIVDHYHILTAKRCYDKVDIGDVLVLVGYYKAWWGRHSQVKPVSKIFRHEYKVALLRLKSSLAYTTFVQAARLPTSVTKMEPDMKKVFGPPYKVVGFVVDRFDVPGDYIDKEKFYKIKEDQLVSFDDCKKNYSRLSLRKESLFCVLGNATYCWGGLGSPVIKYMEAGNYFLQVGVVVSDNCSADTTGPFLVARTDVYAEWIQGHTFQSHQAL